MSSDIQGNQQTEVSTGAPGTTAALANQELPAATPRRQFALRDLVSGNFGQIPVFVGLVVIAIYFQIAGGGYFLTALNLTDLLQQIITIGCVALGSVLVLLIAEIDLSLSAVAFLCGAITGVLSVRAGWSAFAAILAGILIGAIIGAVNGFFVSVLRMPSFIVTLAAFIAYQGLLSQILQPQTTLPIRDTTINSLAVYNVPDIFGVGLPILGVLLYATSLFTTRRNRQRVGLPVKSLRQFYLQIGFSAALVVIILVLFESYRGVPLTALILIGLIAFFWVLTTKTRFGRHLYAVGGNAEAARRAGINVMALRMVVFSLASMLAAIGGILLVSREVSAPAAVDQSLLLNAIAAAVIGGVSLFGGRGSVWAVVLGSLIVGSLINGLALTNQPVSVEQMVEGVVLLIAVLIDAVARRNSATGYR